jgi:bifunctional DNA-binding transcriptional regulator/antitoxin component of YhaV-PrlF toxin-antitoxin module
MGEVPGFIGKFERTRISVKHQITIPKVAFDGAGLEVGDHLHARSDGAGRVVLERIKRPCRPLVLLEDESDGETAPNEADSQADRIEGSG